MAVATLLQDWLMDTLTGETRCIDAESVSTENKWGNICFCNVVGLFDAKILSDSEVYDFFHYINCETVRNCETRGSHMYEYE